MTTLPFEVKHLPDSFYAAPDGSQIRPLLSANQGSMAHCTLEAGQISQAVAHKTIEEIWYFLEGQGEVWLKQDAHEKVVEVSAGMSLTIPTGTHFQFRNTGSGPLRFIIATMPPWPGSDEAYRVADYWPVTESK